MNTLSLGAGQSPDYFFMDVPVYKGSITYRLVFTHQGIQKEYGQH